MPRPSEFIPETRKRIIEAIANGCTREAAAGCAGISRACLGKWIKRGRDANAGDEAFVAFVAAIKEAEWKAVEEAVKAIRKAGKKTWTAFAWWLERKYPGDWSLDRELAAELKKFLREKKNATRAKST